MAAVIGFVEDDDVIRENYADLLREEGYDVATANCSDSATRMFDSRKFDLIILDVSLGNEHDAGYQLCAALRQKEKDLPIIFLTSHDSEIDHISGLRVGADDYLSKGTSFAFLMVRIQTLLRRVGELSRNGRIGAANSHLEIDLNSLSARWRDARVDLSLTQFWMVRELVESGDVLGPDRLMKAANLTVEPNTITAHVKSIRGKFQAIDPKFSCIRTERGRGYRWFE